LDIIIKSFNRPYYLERCIRSIYLHVKGEFHISVLDDGTPVKYLDRIKSLFPAIEIHFSPYYQQKSNAIQKHLENKKAFELFTIPTNFWVQHISNCSENFLLLEDDIWLTSPIHLNQMNEVMRNNRAALIKLSWYGNNKVIDGKKIKVDEGIEEVIPNLSFISKIIFTNKFKIASVLYRLGMYKESFEFQLKFYTIYTVASAFFNKNYWLYLWSGAGGKVDETYQLKKAAEWLISKKCRYFKTHFESATTSFITSATNSYKDVNFDIFKFNFYMNEAWYNGHLNVMENFPKDFRKESIKDILNNAEDINCTYAEWEKWVELFKAQYRKLDFKVDD
jgi:hypothetical protein